MKRSGLSPRILVLPSWYPTPDNRISGIFVKEQVLAMRQKGIRAEVFFPIIHTSGSRWIPRLRLEKIADEGIPTTYCHIYWLNIPRTYNLFFILFTVKAIRHILKREKYDLIHAYVSFPAGIAAWLVSRKAGIPYIITELVSGFKIFYCRSLILYLLVKRLMEKAALLLPCSRALAEEIRAHGVKPQRLITLPVIADENVFYFKKTGRAGGKKVRLLFVGLMAASEQKGVPVLIEAVRRIREEGRTVRPFVITMVGDGVMRRPYEKRIKEAGLERHFQFIGNRRLSEISLLMRDHDFFILPSLHEGLPCVIAESLSAGLPVLASSVGGIPEVVKPFCGILSGPGDAEDLKNKLSAMLGNYKKYNRRKISLYGHSVFGYRVFGDKVAKIYSEALSRD